MSTKQVYIPWELDSVEAEKREAAELRHLRREPYSAVGGNIFEEDTRILEWRRLVLDDGTEYLLVRVDNVLGVWTLIPDRDWDLGNIWEEKWDGNFASLTSFGYDITSWEGACISAVEDLHNKFIETGEYPLVDSPLVAITSEED